MSDTDIYTNRQPMPKGKNKKPPRRRRKRSERRFDDPSRGRRRSKNTGIRRLVHLFRKEENEKAVWYAFVFVMVIVLTLIGIWQFWYLPTVAERDALIQEAAVDADSAAK